VCVLHLSLLSHEIQGRYKLTRISSSYSLQLNPLPLFISHSLIRLLLFSSSRHSSLRISLFSSSFSSYSSFSPSHFLLLIFFLLFPLLVFLSSHFSASFNCSLPPSYPHVFLLLILLLLFFLLFILLFLLPPYSRLSSFPPLPYPSSLPHSLPSHSPLFISSSFFFFSFPSFSFCSPFSSFFFSLSSFCISSFYFPFLSSSSAFFSFHLLPHHF
jgi:hypothetical protein